MCFGAGVCGKSLPPSQFCCKSKLLQKKKENCTQWQGSCFGWDITTTPCSSDLGMAICFLPQGRLSDHRPCVLGSRSEHTLTINRGLCGPRIHGLKSPAGKTWKVRCWDRSARANQPLPTDPGAAKVPFPSRMHKKEVSFKAPVSLGSYAVLFPEDPSGARKLDGCYP